MKKVLVVLLLIVYVSCTEEKQAVSKIEGKRIEISDSIQKNQDIEAFIAPYRERLEESMNTVLSYSPKDMHKNDGTLESTIGNMMADMVFAQANPIYEKRTGKSIDMVLLNHGGIRAPIGKGAVTTRTAFNVMPFENSIVVVEMTSEKVNELIDYLAKANRAHPIMGLKLRLAKDGTVAEATINGQKIAPNTTYHVATNDYLQNGGDGMLFFEKPVRMEILDYKIRNAMIDYFTSVDTIPARLDGRFTQD